MSETKQKLYQTNVPEIEIYANSILVSLKVPLLRNRRPFSRVGTAYDYMIPSRARALAERLLAAARRVEAGGA